MLSLKIFKSSYKLNEKIALSVLCIGILIVFNGCKKLVEVEPPVTSTTGSNVYTSDATAAAVLTGIYLKMSSNSYATGASSTSNHLSLLLGLSADELTLFDLNNTAKLAYYRNALSASSSIGIETWNNIYPVLFICNSAIESLTKNDFLTPAVRQQLLGESKFVRAFCYFYLVNLYGDVPLILTTNYTTNSLYSRTEKKQVYEQIISDLKDAEEYLTPNYVDGTLIKNTSERVRPNKWAAAALLARVYLYIGDYVNAEEKSTVVINNSSLFNLVALNGVFLKNSLEAIWQLQPTSSGFNTDDARLYVLSAPPTGINSSHPVYLSSLLLNSFELNDQRKKNGNWINSFTDLTGTYYFSNKYKVAIQNTAITTPAGMTEYLMVLRLGEQFLIRAEARAQQGNLTGATSDLNAIRERAGLTKKIATTQTDLISTIIHERQVELFTEWGHRWLDLKRTNAIDAVMGIVAPLKGGSWNKNWQLFPIPLYDLQNNQNLGQNDGY
jgi:hypothetical protein